MIARMKDYIGELVFIQHLFRGANRVTTAMGNEAELSRIVDFPRKILFDETIGILVADLARVTLKDGLSVYQDNSNILEWDTAYQWDDPLINDFLSYYLGTKPPQE